jgi:cytochrome P450
VSEERSLGVPVEESEALPVPNVSVAESIRRPPGPTPSPVEAVAASRNRLRFMERVASHGDLAWFRLRESDFYLAEHPDYVRDVLVTSSRRFVNLQTMSSALGNGLLTSEGEFHKRQRRLIQPAFHHKRIAGYGDVMVEYTDRAANEWTDGQEADIHQEMTDLTLAIVCKTLFDTDISTEDAGQFRDALTSLLERSGEGGPFFPAKGRATPAQRQALKETLAIIDEFLYDMIERGRRNPGGGHDILSMLLVAQDEEGDGGGMTDQQVRDEALALVAAGHETVANALTWTWYLLDQHPEAEAKLHAELDGVLDGRLPTAEDLPSLPYTEMVLSESMRLHPPVPMGGRQAVEKHEIGGYPIPEGAKVFYSQHVTQRDPRWWPEPDRFDPERWTTEAKAARPKFAYFPFGGGQRLCIGEGFAWMEGELVIATIARKWQMRLVPGQATGHKTSITLRPAATRMRLLARR